MASHFLFDFGLATRGAMAASRESVAFQHARATAAAGDTCAVLLPQAKMLPLHQPTTVADEAPISRLAAIEAAGPAGQTHATGAAGVGAAQKIGRREGFIGLMPLRLPTEAAESFHGEAFQRAKDGTSFSSLQKSKQLFRMTATSARKRLAT